MEMSRVQCRHHALKDVVHDLGGISVVRAQATDFSWR
jgi:hypothetical protein